MQAVVIVILTVAAMEIVAALSHRYVMHGFGWRLHRSHHEPAEGTFEANDLYAVGFAAVAIALFAIGSTVWAPLFWVAVGVTIYGFLYFVVHDGLVHQRWPFRHRPKNRYLKRLVQAHRLHHAVQERDGAVSFGFLYAPPVDRLRADLRRSVRLRRAGAGPSEKRRGPEIGIARPVGGAADLGEERPPAS